MLQPPVRRHTMQGLLALLLACLCLWMAPALAQNVELPTVRTSRGDGDAGNARTGARLCGDAEHGDGPVYCYCV